MRYVRLHGGEDFRGVILLPFAVVREFRILVGLAIPLGLDTLPLRLLGLLFRYRLGLAARWRLDGPE